MKQSQEMETSAVPDTCRYLRWRQISQDWNLQGYNFEKEKHFMFF